MWIYLTRNYIFACLLFLAAFFKIYFASTHIVYCVFSFLGVLYQQSALEE